MKESKFHLLPFKQRTELPPTDINYVLHLNPPRANEVYVLLEEAIKSTEPSSTRNENIDTSLEERRYKAAIKKVAQKFEPKPSQVAQDPDAFYLYNIALTEKDLNLIQTEVEKLLKNGYGNDDEIDLIMSELANDFIKAQESSKYRSQNPIPSVYKGGN